MSEVLTTEMFCEKKSGKSYKTQFGPPDKTFAGMNFLWVGLNTQHLKQEEKAKVHTLLQRRNRIFQIHAFPRIYSEDRDRCRVCKIVLIHCLGDRMYYTAQQQEIVLFNAKASNPSTENPMQTHEVSLNLRFPLIITARLMNFVNSEPLFTSPLERSSSMLCQLL